MSKKLDLKEFVAEGYLHEINRCFLHPLGLALAVEVADDGEVTLAYILDSREDPEGFIYGEDTFDPQKMAHIADIWAERRLPRIMLVGTMIQHRQSPEHRMPYTVQSDDIGSAMHAAHHPQAG